MKQKRPWEPKVEMRVLKCFAAQLMTIVNLITTMNQALMRAHQRAQIALQSLFLLQLLNQKESRSELICNFSVNEACMHTDN